MYFRIQPTKTLTCFDLLSPHSGSLASNKHAQNYVKLNKAIRTQTCVSRDIKTCNFVTLRYSHYT